MEQYSTRTQLHYRCLANDALNGLSSNVLVVNLRCHGHIMGKHQG